MTEEKNKDMVDFDAGKQKRLNGKMLDLLQEIAIIVQEVADENKIHDPTWMIMNSQVITMTVVQNILDKTKKINESFVRMVNGNIPEDELKKIIKEYHKQMAEKKRKDKTSSRGYQ